MLLDTSCAISARASESSSASDDAWASEVESWRLQSTSSASYLTRPFLAVSKLALVAERSFLFAMNLALVSLSRSIVWASVPWVISSFEAVSESVDWVDARSTPVLL